MKHVAHMATLIFAALREQARAEKAFIGNFWFGLFSRVIYNVMALIFIDVLFKRVGTIAGYTQNDFLFLFFAQQIGFYVSYMLIFQTMQRLVTTVREGNFDLLLLKPVPHRAFLYIQGILPVDFVFTLATTLPISGALIHWGDLAITPITILVGALMWICGIIICNTLLFALVLPSFKTGDASDMLNLFYAITSQNIIPYNNLPQLMKLLSLFILPHLIISGATTAVILQKGDIMTIALPVVAAAIVSLIIYNVSWRYALRNYTSASS